MWKYSLEIKQSELPNFEKCEINFLCSTQTFIKT